MATCAPAATRAAVMEAPMPLEPPVLGGVSISG